MRSQTLLHASTMLRSREFEHSGHCLHIVHFSSHVSFLTEECERMVLSVLLLLLADTGVAFHSGETALMKLISCRLLVTLPLSPQTPISTCPYPRLPDLRKQAISFPSLGWERGMRSESRKERRESPVHLHSKSIRQVSMVMFVSECQSNFRCGTQEIERDEKKRK